MDNVFSVSVEVVSSKKFMSMPTTAQVTYFHLLSNCRDGFLDNWRSILRGIDGRHDDMLTLELNGYIEYMQDGRYRIVDWDKHNGK